MISSELRLGDHYKPYNARTRYLNQVDQSQCLAFQSEFLFGKWYKRLVKDLQKNTHETSFVPIKIKNLEIKTESPLYYY